MKWAPTVVPFWHDLYPQSTFVSNLFTTPLPDGVPHHLLFGFKQDGFINTGSSDSVIELASQLRNEAQDQADLIRCFDEGHVSIQHSDTVISNVFSLLDASR
mgnify:CR=1 FL=1